MPASSNFGCGAPTGTRIERTEQLMVQALDVIAEAGGPDNVAITLGYVGVVPSTYPINTVYLLDERPGGGGHARRPEAGQRRPRSPSSKERLRERRCRRSSATGSRKSWRKRKLPGDEIDERVQAIRLSFEPADIVNEVMSFGSPTPVEVVVSGPKLADNHAYADKLRAELSQQDPALRDLQFAQSLDYPTVDVTIDREQAGLSGVTAEDVARSLLAATSSSRFVVPNFWRDPNTGIGYQVQVEVPPPQMTIGRRRRPACPSRRQRHTPHACPRRRRRSAAARCPANTIATTCAGSSA